MNIIDSVLLGGRVLALRMALWFGFIAHDPTVDGECFRVLCDNVPSSVLQIDVFEEV